MQNEIRLATNIDVNNLKSFFESSQTSVLVDVVFVSDANHDNPDNTTLPIGCILGKSDNFAGKNESVDTIYRPISSNHRNYPIPGEYALVVRTSMGNYYLTTLNLNNDVNNNIDRPKVQGYTQYNDDDSTIKSPIKNTGSTTSLDKITSTNFRVQSTPTETVKYGDVIQQGRYGNSIKLSYSDNQQPLVRVQNGDSYIELFNTDEGYSRKTRKSFTDDTEVSFNNNTGQHIELQSDRVLVNSNGNGVYITSVDSSVGILGDKNVEITADQSLILTGDNVFLGSVSLQQPVVRGREFGDQYVRLLETLHDVADLMSQPNAEFGSIGSYLRDQLNTIVGEKGRVQAKTLTKILSNKIFVE
jgi:hypothetical protein